MTVLSGYWESQHRADLKGLEMSFWEVVWLIFVSFAFVAYLIVMFSIIMDLFRDHETSGGVKAVWIVALIFLPLLTALVYLIARGQGMTERSERAASQIREQQETYIRDVAGQAASPVEQINQAKAMLDQGVISEAEYQRLKEKALA